MLSWNYSLKNTLLFHLSLTKKDKRRYSKLHFLSVNLREEPGAASSQEVFRTNYRKTSGELRKAHFQESAWLCLIQRTFLQSSRNSHEGWGNFTVSLKCVFGILLKYTTFLDRILQRTHSFFRGAHPRICSRAQKGPTWATAWFAYHEFLVTK